MEAIFDRLVCHKKCGDNYAEDCCIIKNQAFGGKRLISEAIVDTVRVYVYCSGYDVDEVLNVELEQMVEEQDG